MARYRVLEKSFINNCVVEAGAEIEYGGEPSYNLELIKPEKKSSAKKDAADSEADSGAE